MYESTPFGRRYFPSATDVLVIAEDQGITAVHLGRVGSVSSGLWSESSRWIGGAVPDFTQDVYIAHGGAVTLDLDRQVKNLSVASGSSIHVQSHRLSVDGGLSLNGAAASVGSGGTIEADTISGTNGTLTTAAGSTVRFNSFTAGASASVSFNGSVAVGHKKNLGSASLFVSEFDPSTITTWHIAEQLAVGDKGTNTTLIINDGADFTSATGRLGASGTNAGIGNVDISGAGSSWAIGGALDARTGTLDVVNQGLLMTGQVAMGEAGRMIATVDNATWNVNGQVDVGPLAPTGLGSASLTIRNSGQVTVAANLNVKGTSEAVSQVTVELGGRVNVGGDVIVSPYGKVTYGANTTAADETFINAGSGVENRLGGVTQFTDNATAGNSTFVNNGGTAIWGLGGQTIFGGTSTAEFANITNHGPTGLYAFVGKTRFDDSASAGSAIIVNLPSSGGATTTDFHGTSIAASATIINRPGSYPTVAGITSFHGSASAGSAILVNENGPFSAGEFIFNDSSTAGQATITNEASGGLVKFYDTATAGQANIVLRGKQNSNLQFYDNSSAGAANIDIGRLTFGPENESNDAQFYGKSTAANATITVRGDGGRVMFAGNSFDHQNPSATAGNAVIVAQGSARPGNIPGTIGGQVLFNSYSTAASATVTAQGATIAGAPGGQIVFQHGGHAGNATLIANGGASAENGGGIRFQSGGVGDSARLVVNAGAFADFSLNASHGGTAVGSIEGAGRFSLGASSLTVGNLNTSTTVSGNITDAGGYHPGIGGALTKVGTGTLTLSGANTYSGLTTVDEGALVINGSLAAGVVVKDGGILTGIGSMGNVVVETGGVLSPGPAPATISFGGLNLMSGSKFEYELGATARDRIVVTNGGNVTLGGVLNLALLDGFNPPLGQTFSLFEGAIGSITGTFSSVNAPTVSGHALTLLYSANQVTLQVTDAVLVPGDFNSNGVVDAADYITWRNGLGTTHTPADYDVWRANFGRTASSGSRATALLPNGVDAAVPEPATWVFAVAGFCLSTLGTVRHLAGRAARADRAAASSRRVIRVE
jgi:autotransporter-associated beta strand protein